MVYGAGSAIDHQVGYGVPNTLNNKGPNGTATVRNKLTTY